MDPKNKLKSETATTDYFVHHKESALLLLIDYANAIYCSKLAKYKLPDEVIEEGTQEMAALVLRAVPKFDINMNDDFILFFMKQINGHVRDTIMGRAYPHISKHNNRLLSCLAMMHVGKGEDEIMTTNKRITKSLVEYAREVKQHSTYSIDDADYPIDLGCGKNVDFGDVIDRRAAFVKLIRIINDMKPRDSEVIRMYYFEGKTLKEIAEVQGVSHQAIDMRIKTLLNKIRDAFGGEQYEVLAELEFNQL